MSTYKWLEGLAIRTRNSPKDTIEKIYWDLGILESAIYITQLQKHGRNISF